LNWFSSKTERGFFGPRADDITPGVERPPKKQKIAANNNNL
jgi:hypothetical protein